MLKGYRTTDVSGTSGAAFSLGEGSSHNFKEYPQINYFDQSAVQKPQNSLSTNIKDKIKAANQI